MLRAQPDRPRSVVHRVARGRTGLLKATTGARFCLDEVRVVYRQGPGPSQSGVPRRADETPA